MIISSTRDSNTLSTGKNGYQQKNGNFDERITPRRSNNKSVKFSAYNEYFEPKHAKKNLAKGIWYSEADYCKMSEKTKKIARRFLNGKLVEGIHQQHTYRGLEDFDEKAYHVRMKVMLRSMKAVLVEQVRQKHVGMNDPIAIANAYRGCGATACQEIASEVGQIDYEVSIQCILNDRSKTWNEDDSALYSGSFVDSMECMRDGVGVVKKNKTSPVIMAGKGLKKLMPRRLSART